MKSLSAAHLINFDAILSYVHDNILDLKTLTPQILYQIICALTEGNHPNIGTLKSSTLEVNDKLSAILETIKLFATGKLYLEEVLP